MTNLTEQLRAHARRLVALERAAEDARFEADWYGYLRPEWNGIDEEVEGNQLDAYATGLLDAYAMLDGLAPELVGHRATKRCLERFDYLTGEDSAKRLTEIETAVPNVPEDERRALLREYGDLSHERNMVRDYDGEIYEEIRENIERRLAELAPA